MAINDVLRGPDGPAKTAIRADIRRTLAVAKGCRIELIMKDVHTLRNEPERAARWVRIAREEIERFHG